MRNDGEISTRRVLPALDGLHPPADRALVSLHDRRPKDRPGSRRRPVGGSRWAGDQAAWHGEALERAERCPASDDECVESRQVFERNEDPHEGGIGRPGPIPDRIPGPATALTECDHTVRRPRRSGGATLMTHDKKRLSDLHFSKEAAEYDRSQRYAPLRAVHPRIAEEALSEPFRTVLDIGCGTGALLRIIQEKGTDARLFGIDLSERMIRMAKAKLGEKADLRVSDSEKLPFSNGAFDLVLCTFSFHHYPDPGAVLSDMRRVLAPSGRLILADPTVPVPLRQLMNLVHVFTKDGTVRIYSKKEMEALVEAAGLEVAKWAKLDWHTYLLAAKKS